MHREIQMDIHDDLVIDATKRKLFDWKELWQFKELFYFFTWRDIKVKYKQTTLGFLWVILQPLMLMLVFTLFFAKTLKVPSQNLPYPVFVFSGLLLWNCFSTGLTNAANSMMNNATIIKKIYFPRLVIPVSSVLVSLFDLVMAFVIFIALLVFYQQLPGGSCLWAWPAAILITTMATLGMGTLLAALTIKYRDFRYVIPFLVQLLFFLSPVIYPVVLLESPVLRFLLALSPMYAAIELFRMPLTNVSPDLFLVTLSISSLIFFLVIGLLYFKNTEDFFADLA